VAQRRNGVRGRADAAAVARRRDRGLAVRVHRVPAAGRDPGVGAGQRTARVTRGAGEMGR